MEQLFDRAERRGTEGGGKGRCADLPISAFDWSESSKTTNRQSGTTSPTGRSAAKAVAQPGDHFLLHAGSYDETGTETVELTGISGTPGQYIAWRAAGDGTVFVRDQIVLVDSHHLWFEGLTFEPAATGFDNSGIFANSDLSGTQKLNPIGIEDLVVVRNTFRDVLDGGVETSGVEWLLPNAPQNPATMSRDWYVADNVFEGSESAFGIQVFHLRDSDLAYNRVDFSDGGGEPNHFEGDAVAIQGSRNVDIYGNDVRNITDDAFELDRSYANVRVWQNRATRTKREFVSFQPMLCGPWYIVRNEYIGIEPDPPARDSGAGLLKPNVFDRFVLINNTMVVRANYLRLAADIMLEAVSRNNLFIHDFFDDDKPGGFLWWGDNEESVKPGAFVIEGQSVADWRSDADYDGFDWETVFADGDCVTATSAADCAPFAWGPAAGGPTGFRRHPELRQRHRH